jgi:hypothetical protein
MEELLKCILCKFPFDMGEKQPVIIKCGHTFCKQCVIAELENELECICCGIVHDLNNENFYVTNYLVVEIIKISGKTETSIRNNYSPGKSTIIIIATINFTSRYERKTFHSEKIVSKNTRTNNSVDNRKEMYFDPRISKIN